MQRLIIDFISRWRWMLLGYVVSTVLLTSMGQPFALTALVLINLLLDSARGLFRAVRPLPISSRDQATTWWLLSIFLLPLLSIPSLAAGTMIYIHTHAALLVPVPSEPGGPMLHWISNYTPWFAAAIAGWVGFGTVAFLFLICRFLPTGPPKDGFEATGRGIIGALWGFSMPAAMMFPIFLPKTPDALRPWHGALFLLVPVFVVVSYFAAQDLMQRRTSPMVGGQMPVNIAAHASSHRRGLTGIPLFISTIVGRGLMMIALIGLSQVLIFGFMFPRTGISATPGNGNPILVAQIVGFAIMFATILVELAGLRALRTLPLSSARLTALLLVAPVAFAALAAGFSCGFGGVGDPARHPVFNFAAQTLAIAGTGSLVLAISLRITSSLRILVVMAAFIVPMAGFGFAAKSPIALALGGLVMLMGGAALLHRGLRKSNACYQSRRMFGLQIGQPMPMR